MKVHLIGIGGTGMGAVAGLLAAAGHDVRGSDAAVYPPMSDQLRALGIPVFEGFAPTNLDWQPDVVVVGNALGKDHVEVAAARERGLTLTSFPAILGDELAAGRHSIVVAGTHGKTTTTSLLGHIFDDAGRRPGMFVGGVPIGLGRGWMAGTGPEFILEGDEYDTAYFDKGSKFLHYHPDTAILTSVELDHVDIFATFEDVRDTFRKFVALIPAEGLLVVCAESADALAVASVATCRVEQYAVVDVGSDAPAGVTWYAHHLEYGKSGRVSFEVVGRGEPRGRFETLLAGRHNVGNVVAAIAVAIESGPAARHRAARGQQLRRHPTPPGAARHRRRRVGPRRLRPPPDRGARDLEGPAPALPQAPHPGRLRAALGHLAPPHVPGRVRGRVRARRSGGGRSPVRPQQDPQGRALRSREAGARSAPVGHTVGAHRGRRRDRQAHRGGGRRRRRRGGAVVGQLRRLPRQAAGGHRRRGDPGPRDRRPGGAQTLASVDLPVDDASDADLRHFFVLRNEHGVVGAIALEVLGEDAILRDLAVARTARGQGLGWILVDVIVQWARYRGVRRIYLLTETASDFFAAKLGFRVVDRTTVSPDIAATTTFERSTDSKFVAMRLDL